MSFVAGEDLERGDLVYLQADGTVRKGRCPISISAGPAGSIPIRESPWVAKPTLIGPPLAEQLIVLVPPGQMDVFLSEMRASVVRENFRQAMEEEP